MNNNNCVVFDLEVQKSIVTDGRKINPETDVNGWANSKFSKMSFGVLFDYEDNLYKIYDQSNIKELEKRLLRAERIVTYNGVSFDYNVLIEDGCNIQASPLRDYDILIKLWAKNGRRERGFKLDEVANLNLGIGKSEDGAEAPKLFQTGQFARLITYCIKDVHMTKLLYDKIISDGFLFAKGGEKFMLTI